MYIHTDMLNDLRDEFEIRDSSYIHDFRLCNPIEHTKGDTYFDMGKCYCNLMHHETIEDIIDTVNHEAKHAALRREELDDETEHIILRKMAWVENDFIDLSE